MNDYSEGGGYMDTSFNSGTTSASAPRRPMGEQTMRPITLRQLLKADLMHDSTLRIDGADVTQVTFVGVIRNITELSTNSTYMIEDGTGALEVKRWIDQAETAENAAERRELQTDMYVRVFGRPNQFNGKISVVSYRIVPITDFNEISYHFLDAIRTHLRLTKGSPGAGGGDMAMGTANNSTASGGNVNDEVLKIIKQYQESDTGASVEVILSALRGQYDETKIRDAIEYLSNEGHCYTTIDDNHFKSTESF